MLFDLKRIAVSMRKVDEYFKSYANQLISQSIIAMTCHNRCKAGASGWDSI